MDKLKAFKDEMVKSLNREIPEIWPGDTVKVYTKVKEGNKERIQVFAGIVIRRRGGRGLDGTFTVRKESNGIGVEKIFPYYSPSIEKIEVVQRGRVRRARLYYLRERRGKAAKIRKKGY